MKINEIVTENAKGTQLRKSFQKGATGAQSWPDLDNGNVPYLQYRFGLLLAGSPDIETADVGPIGGQLITLAYTSADAEKIEFAAKGMGITPAKISGKKSQEMDMINKQSIARGREPIALNKKKK